MCQISKTQKGGLIDRRTKPDNYENYFYKKIFSIIVLFYFIRLMKQLGKIYVEIS